MINICPEEKWICPLCDRKFKRKHHLARHMAMNRVSIHSNWRRGHGFKAFPSKWPEINQITEQIMNIIGAHPEKYRR